MALGLSERKEKKMPRSARKTRNTTVWTVGPGEIFWSAWNSGVPIAVQSLESVDGDV